MHNASKVPDTVALCAPQYALKIERKSDVRTIQQEYRVLKQLRGGHQLCRPCDSGTHEGRFFMIMQLLGANLAEVRREVAAGTGGRMDLELVKVTRQSTG